MRRTTFVLAVAAAASLTSLPAYAQPLIDCGPDEQFTAADAYLAALADPSLAAAVPFDEHAVRWENGLQTGFSGAQMRRDLELHIQYSVMAAPVVTSREVSTDPDVVRYRFVVPVVLASRHIANAPTDETLVIPRETCLITRIDATIGLETP